MRNYHFAEIAYTAYRQQKAGMPLNPENKLLGFWDSPDEVRDAWWAAAEAVRFACGHMLRGEQAETGKAPTAPNSGDSEFDQVRRKIDGLLATLTEIKNSPRHYSNSTDAMMDMMRLAEEALQNG
jgi:hypothetical protein